MNALNEFTANVKANTVHTALDLAEKQMKIYAENRNMFPSVTRYEILNAEPTGIENQKIWKIKYT